MASGAHAARVRDGAGWHVGDKPTVPDNVSLVEMPPHAPEVDPVETVGAHLRGTKLPHGPFNS